MKRYKMIGMTRSGKCCVLTCLLPFEKLKADELEESDFQHGSVDWGGCGPLKETLRWNNIRLTGNELVLQKPLVFHGEDFDMGHSSYWEVSVYKILDAEEDKNRGRHGSQETMPLVHGRWVPKDKMSRSPYAKNYYCSVCGFEPVECTRFCGDCAAKMDMDHEGKELEA